MRLCRLRCHRLENPPMGYGRRARRHLWSHPWRIREVKSVESRRRRNRHKIGGLRPAAGIRKIAANLKMLLASLQLAAKGRRSPRRNVLSSSVTQNVGPGRKCATETIIQKGVAAIFPGGQRGMVEKQAFLRCTSRVYMCNATQGTITTAKLAGKSG